MDGLISYVHGTPGGRGGWMRVTLAAIHLECIWTRSPCGSTALHPNLKSSSSVNPVEQESGYANVGSQVKPGPN